jgi:hypothetical protein
LQLSKEIKIKGWLIMAYHDIFHAVLGEDGGAHVLHTLVQSGVKSHIGTLDTLFTDDILTLDRARADEPPEDSSEQVERDEGDDGVATVGVEIEKYLGKSQPEVLLKGRQPPGHEPVNPGLGIDAVAVVFCWVHLLLKIYYTSTNKMTEHALRSLLRTEAKVALYCQKLTRAVSQEGKQAVFEAFGDPNLQALLLDKVR